MEINEFIKNKRQRQGLTQKALASKANVSQPTIAQIEQGRRGGTLSCVESIIHALGYDLAVRKIGGA